jgi:hypothetical protein
VQGPFFGYFLLGLEKKVTRLPAGTGEVDVQVFLFRLTTAIHWNPGQTDNGKSGIVFT